MVNNVVFPAIDLILAVFFFAKLGTAYFDFRKSTLLAQHISFLKDFFRCLLYTSNRRTHFTPIWYPDGNYTPYTWLLDCWTPTGMLSMNLTDSVRITGDLWEEWHIAPSK